MSASRQIWFGRIVPSSVRAGNDPTGTHGHRGAATIGVPSSTGVMRASRLVSSRLCRRTVRVRSVPSTSPSRASCCEHEIPQVRDYRLQSLAIAVHHHERQVWRLAFDHRPNRRHSSPSFGQRPPYVPDHTTSFHQTGQPARSLILTWCSQQCVPRIRATPGRWPAGTPLGGAWRDGARGRHRIDHRTAPVVPVEAVHRAEAAVDRPRRVALRERRLAGAGVHHPSSRAGEPCPPSLGVARGFHPTDQDVHLRPGRALPHDVQPTGS
jgi:hypothetical protein